MFKIKKICGVLLIWAMMLTLIPVQSNAAKKVKLNKSKLSLYAGKSYTLKLKGNKKRIKWSSSRKSIATVSSKMKVKAKKKGTCKITAKVGKKKYVCKVTVKTKKNNNTSIKTVKSISTPTPSPTITTDEKSSKSDKFDLLANYIQTYGNTNSSGNKFINSTKTSNSDGYIDDYNYGVAYDLLKSKLTFIYSVSSSQVGKSSQSNQVLTIDIYKSEKSNGYMTYINDSTYSAGIKAGCNLISIQNLSDIHKGFGNNVNWNIVSISSNLLYETYKSSADTCMYFAYMHWNSITNTNAGISLVDLGFGS